MSNNEHIYRGDWHYDFPPEDQDCLGAYLYGLSAQQRLDLLRATINDRDGKYCIRIPLRGGGFRNYVITSRTDSNGVRVLSFKRSSY